MDPRLRRPAGGEVSTRPATPRPGGGKCARRRRSRTQGARSRFQGARSRFLGARSRFLGARSAGLRTGRGALVALVAAALSGASSPGGTLLIVDPRSPETARLARRYAAARDLPPGHVLRMVPRAASYAEHVDQQQRALLGELAQRRLSDQIDVVVIAPCDEFFVPEPIGLVSDGCFAVHRFSLTAVYAASFISDEILGGVPSSLRNHYYGVGTVPLGFDVLTGWSFGAAVPTGSHYLLCAQLGYLGERGNTVAEVEELIDRSAAADGAFPPGTFYFMRTTDPLRSPPRDVYFDQVVAQLAAVGASGEVIDGVLPIGQDDALGILTGWANPDIEGADMTILEGAYCDHLTSFAGRFDTPAQTKMSRWIARGASATHGAVEEPCNYPGKFPHPRVLLHAAQGASLGEAIYRNLEFFPFQGLVYGDPLARPFAHLPVVTVPDAPTSPVDGPFTVTPEAVTDHPTAAIEAFRILVDGVWLGDEIVPGAVFTVDPGHAAIGPDGQGAPLADGLHELRVIAYDDTLVRAAGELVVPFEVARVGRSVTLTTTAPSGDLSTLFSLEVEGGADVEEIQLWSRLGPVAAVAASGVVELPGSRLGAGSAELRAWARYADGSGAVSAPLSLEVTPDNPPDGTPGASPPAAYGYTRTLASLEPALVDLIASDADGSQLTYEVLAGPAQGVLLPFPAGPQLLFEPAQGGCGEDVITFVAHDGAASSAPADIVIRYPLQPFLRGEVNGDGVVDLGDPIALLGYLFLAGPPPESFPAADANADGNVDIGDSLYLLAYLFGGGAPPAAPFPAVACP